VLDLNQADVFVHVVQHGGVLQAARAMGVPKSTVSRRLAALEERLGVRLLQRTSRSLSLTEDGAAYYERIAPAMELAREAEEALGRRVGAVSGVLRVNAPMLFGQRLLGPIAVEYLRRHPGVQIELELDDRAIDLLHDRCDVAIRVGALDDSTLVARRLAGARLVLCASPAYLDAAPPLAAPEDLAHHECIVHAGERAWRLQRGEDVRTVVVRGRMRTRSPVLRLEAVLAGLGVTWLPEFACAEAIAARRLVPLLEGWRGPEAAMFAIYPSSRQLSPKVRAFVDLLAERLDDRGRAPTRRARK
jgi:DNA-binding transcriptional LysR family regulator